MSSTRARWLGVVGDPIAHSRSPAMHQAALRVMGLAHHYGAYQVEPTQLHTAVMGAKALGFLGLNVTVPHKTEALRVATASSVAAQRIGATNTLHFLGEEIVAHNTDAQGFSRALVNLEPQPPRRALILGAGGAARAVVDALALQTHPTQIDWVSRNPAAVEIASAWRDCVTTHRWDVLEPSSSHALGFDEIDLIVNATTVGMSGGPRDFPVALGLERCAPQTRIADLIVPPPSAPKQDTELLKGARARGLVAMDGRAMLLWQGVAALEIWLGESLPQAAIAAMASTLELEVGLPASVD